MSEDKINKLEVNMAQLSGSINLITEVVRRIEDKLDKHTDKEESFIDLADDKYASKTLHQDVHQLREKLEQRQYEWLKWSIITLFTVLTTIFVYNKFGL